MIVFAKIDYRSLQGISATTVLIGVGFLLMVLVMGTEIKGASRWVRLGPFNFQPSELAKFSVVLHTAHLLSAPRAIFNVRFGELGCGAGQAHHGIPEGHAGTVRVPVWMSYNLHIGTDLKAPKNYF